MNFNSRTFQLAAAICISTLIYGCVSNKEKDVEKNLDDSVTVDENITEKISKAKQVFYSLPSPIETAMLIKRAGAKYNEEILNPVTNVGKYTTNKSRALNLGIFSADLSFASLFDQTQTSIMYMSASKKLADDLGILGAIDNTIIERLESNINQKDSIMSIISETFSNSNSFLRENDRAATASVILVGGWIEGLYIATKIAKTTESNDELVDRIIDQRLSLKTVLNLTEQYLDNEDVKSLNSDLKELENIYSNVKITTSKIEPITDKETKITTLQAKSEKSISPEIFTELCDKVDKLRNKYTK